MTLKPVVFCVVLGLLFLRCSANDGAFKVNGNQLIPMYETDISVRKEILSIKRIGSMQAQITVYYEFFNPKAEKAIEVGFEAFSPSGDADYSARKDGQRYISHFTVNLNDSAFGWQVVIVKDKSYYRDGKFRVMPFAEAKKASAEEGVDFFYVYHFKAHFRKGLNVLKHTYVVDLSSSVAEVYSLQYVLTAAKRWANKQIDDFTLQIDMGEYQEMDIARSFFSNAAEWSITGIGKAIDRPRATAYDSVGGATFFVRNGQLVFKKENFRPRGELHLSESNGYAYSWWTEDRHKGKEAEGFDRRLDDLPFAVEASFDTKIAVDELSKRILRNLPFARRGYVFKVSEIQDYYSHQPWYVADPNYQPVIAQLTVKEQELLK